MTIHVKMDFFFNTNSIRIDILIIDILRLGILDFRFYRVTAGPKIGPTVLQFSGNAIAVRSEAKLGMLYNQDNSHDYFCKPHDFGKNTYPTWIIFALISNVHLVESSLYGIYYMFQLMIDFAFMH